MNGPLGDPEHVGRDLKNVFLEKNQDGVAFAVRPNPDDHQASRIYMPVHSMGFGGAEEECSAFFSSSSLIFQWLLYFFAVKSLRIMKSL